MTQPLLEPDRNQLEIFIDALFRGAGTNGYVSLRTFPEGDGNSKAIDIVGVPLVAGFPALCDRAVSIAGKAAVNPTPAVFCPPVAVFIDREHAREQDLVCGPALSVECDQHPQEARQTLERILGRATVVVCSGGMWTNGDGVIEDKLHLHWRVAPAVKEKPNLLKLKHAKTRDPVGRR
jgi:hypothetical protein